MSTWPPAWVADEEARAQLWRDQRDRRVAFQRWLWFERLAGNPVARRQLMTYYQALIDWLLEAQAPDTEPQDDYGFDTFGISNSVNVGT